jgi:regulator of replication initiation timing
VAEAKERYQQIHDRYEKLKHQSSSSIEEAYRARQEADNLKELIRIKDIQMENWLNADERDKQLLERVSRENKDLRGQMTKREFEMKDLAKMAKMQIEENIRLKNENEKLAKEND